MIELRRFIPAIRTFSLSRSAAVLAAVLALQGGAAAAQTCPDPGLADSFTKYTSVFGVHIFATQTTRDSKITHAAGVMAQYLDNDQDGVVDDQAVLDELHARDATLVMFRNEQDENTWDPDIGGEIVLQNLYDEETHPGYPASPDPFDASLEEVLHLISSGGHANTYPAAFGETTDTAIADAMDIARGGRFFNVPSQYPSESWYHYDDQTCDYACQITEYFYWALTSLLGGQSPTVRCDDISIEWEPCTAALVQSTDPAVYALLTDPQYNLPTVLPDGNYTGSSLPGISANPCAGAPAPDEIRGCRKAVRKLYPKYADKSHKAQIKCLDSVNSGVSFEACPDSRAQSKIAKAASKVDPEKLARYCDAAVIAAAGFGGGCSAALSAADVAACVLTSVDSSVAAMLATEYADDAPSGSIADNGELSCQRAIGKAMQRYAAGRVKALASCQAKLDQGKVGSCPDSKASAAIAKLDAKASASISSRCDGSDVSGLNASSAFGGSCALASDVSSLVDCQRTDHQSETDGLIGLLD